MAKIPKAQQWPLVMLGHRHNKTRQQALEIINSGSIPNLRCGGKRINLKKNKHPELMKGLVKFDSDDVFRPTSSKRRKSEKVKVSYDGSKEHWTPKIKKSSNSNNYIKGKTLDYEVVSSIIGKAPRNTKVRGRKEIAESEETEGVFVKRLTTDASSQMGEFSGQVRVQGRGEGIVLTTDEVKEVSSRGFITDTSVSAGLLLLDRKLNINCKEREEDIRVYSIASVRLILSGVTDLVFGNKFIAIIPKTMSLDDFDQAKRAADAGIPRRDFGGFHYTLVSNLHCGIHECKVYETKAELRHPNLLLNSEGKRLLKLLCNRVNDLLTIRCVDVCIQKENECGALAFFLAQQLCFHQHQGGLNKKLPMNVRSHLLDCLMSNQLLDPPRSEEFCDINEVAEDLFSFDV